MSLGPMELALLLGIALLIFGPSRLPGLGKSLGDAIRGFKKGIDGEDEPKNHKPSEQIVASDERTPEKTATPEKDKNKV